MGNKENVSEIRKALFEKLIAPDYICDPDDVEDFKLDNFGEEGEPLFSEPVTDYSIYLNDIEGREIQNIFNKEFNNVMEEKANEKLEKTPMKVSGVWDHFMNKVI